LFSMPDSNSYPIFCCNGYVTFLGSGILPLWGDSMIEAIRINLKNEKDAELVIGRILALVNRDNKTRNVEILDEFLKYNAKTPTLRIFVD